MNGAGEFHPVPRRSAGSGVSSRWNSGRWRSGSNAGSPFIRSISLALASAVRFQTATAAEQGEGDVLIVAPGGRRLARGRRRYRQPCAGPGICRPRAARTGRPRAGRRGRLAEGLDVCRGLYGLGVLGIGRGGGGESAKPSRADSIARSPSAFVPQLRVPGADAIPLV